MKKQEWLEALEKSGRRGYPDSVHRSGDTLCAMVQTPEGKKLAAEGPAAAGFEGVQQGKGRLCGLTERNAAVLMSLFPETAPTVNRDGGFSMGLGDRLGLATPGHVQAVAEYRVFPVFAQQSMRELHLTGRTYRRVIADACFGVFQSGYAGGYGADGDHLKTPEEIALALDSGCSMITLDCSERMCPDAAGRTGDGLRSAYLELPPELRQRLEARYLQCELPCVGVMGREQLERAAVMFWKAVEHAVACYGRILTAGRAVDFELSIDESPAETTPAEHFFVANELRLAGVRLTSLAPHFCGRFEKGVDYRGDLEQFRQELVVHQAIAGHFGYRLSLHSGSDKFSVFPAFGAVTGCRAHVKTAGTSWLEAMGTLAAGAPALFRQALEFAMTHRTRAEAYYHVSGTVKEMVPPGRRSDAELPQYLQEDAARQTIHIMYGCLLAEPWFREAFFAWMEREEAQYGMALTRHIRRHLEALGVPKRTGITM